MTRNTVSATALLLLASTFAACSAGDDAPDALAPSLSRTDGCAETICDLLRDECHDDIEDCNDTCLNGRIESFSACYAVCRSIDCPLCTGDSPCAEPSYEFAITGTTDASVEEACLWAARRDEHCGETLIDPDCTRAAKLERQEVAAAYRCLAKTACGADAEECFSLLPESDFGTHLCRRIAAACPDSPCTPENVAATNELGRWYEKDVLAAGLLCLAEGCSDGIACFDAWWKTLSNESD